MCVSLNKSFSKDSVHDFFFYLTEFAKNFGVKAATKTSVLLTWEVPDTYKPQVPFKVTPTHNNKTDVYW